MTAQKDSISNKMISGLLTAGMSGLFFTTQALATEYIITDGQLAPNPNQAGDVIHINGSATNISDYDNAGAIELNNGANLTNRAFNSSPVFTNRQASTLTNSGMNVVQFAGGGGMYSHSQIINQATLINTDIGTTIRNLNGAVLENSTSSGFIFPPPIGIYSPSAAVFSNRQGATVINSGAYGVTLDGYTDYKPSTISNNASFTNSDAGSVINNENGAWLDNGGNSDNGATPATAVMVNKNGASINNAGAYTWQNEAGYQSYISASINNNALFSNSGENSQLNNLNGASVNNGSRTWAGVTAAPNTLLSNDNAATLTNSGAFTYSGAGGFTNLIQSTINNIQATLSNSGVGSQLLNDHGGVINNDGASYASYLSSNPTVLNNDNGAVLTNSGAYVWLDETGVARVSQTSIRNDSAAISNSGAGSRLENLNGAVLNNGGSGWIGSSDTTLTNQNGATLTNAGIYHWQDEKGQNQETASVINNQGTLINTGTGSTLNNLSGAQLNNSLGTLKNLDGALLANGAGASVRNDGRIVNDALITNAGSFQAGFGSIEGGGHYIQTAGETVIGNGSQWTQASTEIHGGTLKGEGTLNGAVVIDGGSLQIGDPANYNLGFPLTHPGLTINGELSFNSGLIKINVGSDGLPIFGFFGDPFLVGAGHVVSDALNVNGSASFSGGVVEIDFLSGYAPSLGESLAWLTATDSITGLENLQYRFTGLANNRALAFNHDGNKLTWTVTTAPVPLPAAGWLFFAGLLGMFQASRHKSRPSASWPA